MDRSSAVAVVSALVLLGVAGATAAGASPRLGPAPKSLLLSVPSDHQTTTTRSQPFTVDPCIGDNAFSTKLRYTEVPKGALGAYRLFQSNIKLALHHEEIEGSVAETITVTKSHASAEGILHNLRSALTKCPALDFRSKKASIAAPLPGMAKGVLQTVKDRYTPADNNEVAFSTVVGRYYLRVSAIEGIQTMAIPFTYTSDGVSQLTSLVGTWAEQGIAKLPRS